jgi:hypothetical protein
MRTFGFVLSIAGLLLMGWALIRFVLFARIINFWPPMQQYESTTVGITIIGASLLFLGIMHVTERM